MKPLLNQIPTITRVNAYRHFPAQDTYTIHIREYQGLSTRAALGLFKAFVIITLYR
jgi:hypothetical protein